MKFKELKENIDKISKKIFDIKESIKDRKKGEGFKLDVWIEKLRISGDRRFWHVIYSDESLGWMQKYLSAQINTSYIDYNEDEEVFIRIDILGAYKIDKIEDIEG